MSELAVTLLRVGYLVLLWAFVFSALAVLRRDVFSATKVTPRGRGRTPKPTRPARTAPAPAPRSETPVNQAFPSAPPASAAPSAPTTPVRQSITRPPSRLVVTSGNLTGTSVPLGRSAIVIGRSQSCTLVLDDDFASSRHARLYPDGDTWYIEDLGSTNGTLLDQRPVQEPAAVSAGSTIRIGRTAMELSR